MNLGDAVKERMKEKDISVKTLSSLTGIAPTTLYSFFQRGGEGLSISSFLKIAHVLDISADELYARSKNDPHLNPLLLTDENKEIIGKNIMKYMRKKNISLCRLADELDISEHSLSSWLHAKTYPKIEYIEMMANYFGISKETLIGISEKIDCLTQKEIELIKSYRHSDDVTKIAITRLLAYNDQITSEKETKK